MAAKTLDNTLSPEEIAQRRDEALRRALNTLPQPRHEKVKESNRSKSAPSGASTEGKRGQADKAS